MLLVAANGEGRVELGDALSRHPDLGGMVAATLSMGLCLAERYRPELAFVDLGAASVHGFDACRVLSSLPTRSQRRCRVIAGTATVTDGIEKPALMAGAANVTLFPFPLGLFESELDRLEERLGRAKSVAPRERLRESSARRASSAGALDPVRVPDSMPGESPVRRHAAWGLACLALVVVSPDFERLNNPNGDVRIWATRAIVQHHVLNIDELQREWGYVNDKAKNQHHIYSGKAPGVSFVGVPVSWAHTKLRGLVGWPAPGKRETTFWLRLFAVKPPMCLFLFFFARYVERTTGSAYARDLLVAALGLGTPLYPYGGIFVGHALAAAAAFTAFMLLDDDREGRRVALRLALAGLFAGLTVVFEYQAALVSAAVAVYEAALPAAAGGAGGVCCGRGPPAVALGIYLTGLSAGRAGFPWQRREPAVRAHGAQRRLHGLSLPQLEGFSAFLFSPAYGLFAFRRCWCWA